MNFTEQIEVHGAEYHLRSIVPYAGPGDLPVSSTGGHYTAYVRGGGGEWVLHDDLYTCTRAPVLDDPANTAALYVCQEPPVEEPAYELDTTGMLPPAGPRSDSPSSAPGATPLPSAGTEACRDRPTDPQPLPDAQEGTRIEATYTGKPATTRPGEGSAAPPGGGAQDRQPGAGCALAEGQAHRATQSPPGADPAVRGPAPAPGPTPAAHPREATPTSPTEVPSMTETITTISEALNASRNARDLEKVPAEGRPRPGRECRRPGEPGQGGRPGGTS